MENCERCGKSLTEPGGFKRHMMSMFNTQECCIPCIEKERAHPDYEKAREAERSAIANGDFNFIGIGLPEDLKVTEEV